MTKSLQPASEISPVSLCQSVTPIAVYQPKIAILATFLPRPV